MKKLSLVIAIILLLSLSGVAKTEVDPLALYSEYASLWGIPLGTEAEKLVSTLKEQTGITLEASAVEPDYAPYSTIFNLVDGQKVTLNGFPVKGITAVCDRDITVEGETIILDKPVYSYLGIDFETTEPGSKYNAEASEAERHQKSIAEGLNQFGALLDVLQNKFGAPDTCYMLYTQNPADGFSFLEIPDTDGITEEWIMGFATERSMYCSISIYFENICLRASYDESSYLWKNGIDCQPRTGAEALASVKARYTEDSFEASIDVFL